MGVSYSPDYEGKRSVADELGRIRASADTVHDPQQRANRVLMESACQAAASMIRRTLEDVGGAPGVNHWRLRLTKALDALEGR